MTLNAGTLADNLQAIGPQATVAGAAAAWASAVGSYAAGVVPVSTTAAAATATLQTALTTVFGWAQAAYGMEIVFATFATTLGVGMAGAGFTGAPPVGSVGFAALFATPVANAQDAAEAVANAIHTWMTSGTAALIAPPNTVSNWA